MTPRGRFTALLGVVLLVIILAGGAFIFYDKFFGPKTITAYFDTATAIYPGDEVRVAGVKVGNIDSIHPEGTQARMVMKVDRDVPIPENAKAVIVAQNLVAARYVQLTPAYRSSGPVMHDGAVIPRDRTVMPVEWDEVKAQLMRLSHDFGPNSQVSEPSIARFIDTAADALQGNGDKLRQTLAELSAVGRILANGSGNIASTIKNLQILVTILRASDTQLAQFNDRLAALTGVVNDSRSDLDAALTNLSTAVGEVSRFISETRNQTSEQVQRLANVTQVLVDKNMALQNVLHVAPNALANFYNDYNPDTGTVVGGFGIPNFQNPTQLFCSNIGAVENVTSTETNKLCSLYFGPGLRLLTFNSSPIPLDPFLQPSARPENIIYTEPRLAPGGEGPKPGPPEIPPAVSAYTGLPGDTPPQPPPPPPPGRIPGAAMPQPPPPTTAQPPPPSLQGMLLPPEGSQP